MKINGFEVECDLNWSPEAVITGWFEVPSIPHTRYTIEIDVEGMRIQKEAAELGARDAALQAQVDAGEICGTCGEPTDDWPLCEIEGCPHAVIVEATQEERDALNAEIEAGGDPEADHEQAKSAEVPNTDGTASDDDAPVVEEETVLMPDGEVAPVLPADVAGSDDHADPDP